MAQLNTKRGLMGGSEGEPEFNNGHPFFHADVKAIRLVGKNTYGVRLMPAFDHNLPAGSDEFKLGWVPYRDRDNVDPQSGRPRFTPFYYVVKGYNFLGNDQASFISPLTEHSRDNRGIDPLHDIHYTAKNHSNPDWKALASKPTDVSEGYSAVIPAYKRFTIANALVEIDRTKEIENRLIVFDSACLDMLKETLNMYRPSIVKDVVDPEWEEYLFGDVTSPQYGSWATVKRTPIPGNKMGLAVPGFHFSHKPESLQGHTPYPLADEWGNAFLRGRYNIGDTTNVTKIWTAEEILDFVVNDGFVPYDLVVEACSRHWVVPPEPTHASYHQVGGEDQGGAFVPPAGAVQEAPPRQVAPPRPVTPTTPPRPTTPGQAPQRPAPTAPAANRPVTPPRPTTGQAPQRQPAPGQRPGSTPPPPRVTAPAAASAKAPVVPSQRPPAGAAQKPPQAPAPVEQQQAAPEPAAPQPLDANEQADYDDLCARFNTDPQSGLSADEMARFTAYADRMSATPQQ
jgi:hypothetical protein